MSDEEKIYDNCGKILFLLVYLFGYYDAEPEEALADEMNSYIGRLHKVEEKLLSEGVKLSLSDRKKVKKTYDET